MNPHDVGGLELHDTALNLNERSYEYWERSIHAIMVILVSMHKLTVDEMRRGIEALPSHTYEQWGYYEKWAASIATICIERNTFTESQFTNALGMLCFIIVITLLLHHSPLYPVPTLFVTSCFLAIIDIHKYINAYTHTNIHTHTYTYIHTHTHTHIQTRTYGHVTIHACMPTNAHSHA